MLFALAHRRLPHFGRPVTFSDKINWRILNDRRPLLEWTCDKLAMKDYALKEAPAGLHVPRTIWSGSDIRSLETAELPEHWVLKPNHRTGLVYFGKGRPDQRELSAVTATWFNAFEANRLREWAYSKARPMLFVEELMGTPGTSPPDYKFFVFDGKVALVDVHIDQAHGTPGAILYTVLVAARSMEWGRVGPGGPAAAESGSDAGDRGATGSAVRLHAC